MPVEFETHITRDMVRANRDKIYVFGDNLKRYGMGGQAKEMRGEPNSFGVVTKREPNNNETAFFNDRPDEILAVASDLHKLAQEHNKGKVIVFPMQGLGTGRAELKKRSPAIFHLIRIFVIALQNSNRF